MPNYLYSVVSCAISFWSVKNYVPTVALSLLVFFVFALQCTSTIAVMARETGSWRWPALAFSYMLGLAYAASFLTYRAATALL